jgi:hypothetical protein
MSNRDFSHANLTAFVPFLVAFNYEEVTEIEVTSLMVTFIRHNQICSAATNF